MSATATPEPPLAAALAPEAVASTEAAPRKSYRRKYRKIMVNFQQKMQESTSLFKDEQRILDISQRLAEQTDQLLDLLAEINSLPQVPKSLRFDLRSKHEAANAKPDPDTQYKDEESGHLALRKARYQLQTGQLGASDYADLKDSVLQSPAFAAGNSYASLTQSAALPPRSRADLGDDTTQSATPFLTAKQEEHYLHSLDGYVDGTSATPRAHAANNLGAKNPDKSSERDKEMQLQNPVSVYNWLRKHEPKVFLQDNEPTGDKAPRATGSRISKRNANRESIIKQEQELYDDEGIAVDAGGAGKGKRKRDDDGGYRPKGGNRRPSEKRKEEGPPPPPVKRGGKKLCIDARL